MNQLYSKHENGRENNKRNPTVNTIWKKETYSMPLDSQKHKLYPSKLKDDNKRETQQQKVANMFNMLSKSSSSQNICENDFNNNLVKPIARNISEEKQLYKERFEYMKQRFKTQSFTYCTNCVINHANQNHSKEKRLENKKKEDIQLILADIPIKNENVRKVLAKFIEIDTKTPIPKPKNIPEIFPEQDLNFRHDVCRCCRCDPYFNSHLYYKNDITNVPRIKHTKNHSNRKFYREKCNKKLCNKSVNTSISLVNLDRYEKAYRTTHINDEDILNERRHDRNEELEKWRTKCNIKDKIKQFEGVWLKCDRVKAIHNE